MTCLSGGSKGSFALVVPAGTTSGRSGPTTHVRRPAAVAQHRPAVQPSAAWIRHPF